MEHGQGRVLLKAAFSPNFLVELCPVPLFCGLAALAASLLPYLLVELCPVLLESRLAPLTTSLASGQFAVRHERSLLVKEALHEITISDASSILTFLPNIHLI